jgi:glycerol kinase
VGLTRACGPAELARAALESVAYQTHDLIAAMHEDGIAPTRLRVDGGMVANEWLLQFLADILQLDVDRPEIMETTALGAAYLAGRRCGVFGSFEEFAARWRLDARFHPRGTTPRQALLAGWRKAVQRVLS